MTTTPTVAQNALDSSMAQSVLSDLNNPSTDTASATEVNGYRDGSSLVDHSINVPMESGRLNIRRTGERLNGSRLNLTTRAYQTVSSTIFPMVLVGLRPKKAFSFTTIRSLTPNSCGT